MMPGMKISLVSRDPEMIAEARAAYKLTDTLKVYADWQDALAHCKGVELMIVDLIATLTEPNKISGYEQFALEKMGNKVASGIPLVIIAPPDNYNLDSMVGWPGFVFGHVRRPVTMKIFRRISTWV
jgi:hypothetical protein